MPKWIQHIPRPASYSVAPVSLWDGIQPDWQPTITDVATALSQWRQPFSCELEYAGARASAVLILLCETDQHGVEVLLTRRSEKLRNHPGQVSFPGGIAEPDENPWDTAVREAYEEVGLAPGFARAIGTLDHISPVVSATYISPYVAAVSQKPALTPNLDEVAEIRWVALNELVQPEVFREELWSTPQGVFPIWFFELDHNTVWGATAAMLRQLLRVVLSGGRDQLGVRDPTPQ